MLEYERCPRVGTSLETMLLYIFATRIDFQPFCEHHVYLETISVRSLIFFILVPFYDHYVYSVRNDITVYF